MKQTKWTKKRSEGLPRWAMGLLMGLCINLLFRVLLDQGCDGLPAALVCLAFGAVLYLSALYAQGLPVSQLFRLRRS